MYEPYLIEGRFSGCIIFALNNALTGDMDSAVEILQIALVGFFKIHFLSDRCRNLPPQ